MGAFVVFTLFVFCFCKAFIVPSAVERREWLLNALLLFAVVVLLAWR